MFANDIMLGKLPEVFRFDDGSTVDSPEAWRERREEIIKTAVALEYGGIPPKPDEITLERLHTPLRGRKNSYRIHIRVGQEKFSFVFHTEMPTGDGPFPIIMTGDGCYEYFGDDATAEAKRRGYTVVRFDRTEIAPDIYNSDRTSGIYPLFPDLHFSAISAWAWGYMRMVDVLSEIPFLDMENIAITGHSRGGKAVLLAGAMDERIRFVNPNGSGAHGCGCFRYLQNEEDGSRSERLADLLKAVPYWLGPEMSTYSGREEMLPHDMHFIKALIAPRYLYETNGEADIWANPRGSYLSSLAARPVWELLGEGGTAVHYRSGGHAHTLSDITAFLDFIDSVRMGKGVLTDVLPKGYENLAEKLK